MALVRTGRQLTGRQMNSNRKHPIQRSRVVLLVWAILAITWGGAAGYAETSLTLQEILGKVESQYQHLQAYTAIFKQVTSSAATSITTEAAGRLYYQKPKQMRWEYQTPEVQTFVVNNQLAWLYVPEEKQISLFDANVFFSSPLSRAFFEGMFELKKQFQVVLDHAQSNQQVAVLVMTPKEEDPNIQSLRLQIDLKTYQILTLETKDALGNTNRILLESQKAKSDQEARLFQLEVPPSTVVVDAGGRELSAAEIQKLKDQTK
jgi:outer membrane lipoprotein carrier protein